MNKKGILLLIVILLLGIGIGFLSANGFAAKEHETNVNVEKAMVYFGDVPISEYKIVTHDVFATKEAVDELQDYVYGKTGVSLKAGIRGGSTAHTIRLVCDKNAESGKTVISGGRIEIYGNSASDCVKAVRTFANAYLGWNFAGENNSHISTVSNEIYNPEEVSYIENPWIAQREPIVCLWKTNVPRGQYYNPNASLLSEVLTYSDDQLYEYVKMMKACGFNGIQVTDMCSAWAQYSGYEFVHDRLRFMANAAHSLNMKFTLWVWGAEFDGYGWEDDSVVYYDYFNYKYSFDCPEAYATFDKYYSIYAELADCSDRVIMHFDDPSQITNSVEIATYAALLYEKFSKINPDIEFGISDYTNKYDKAVLVDYVGMDCTIYSGAVTAKDTNYAQFRQDVKNTGANYGVWSWNLCEMEIDQIAEMNVNPHLIKNVYERTKNNGEDIIDISYWSEMDSYHLVNLFSLYCAGHMLMRPEASPDDILYEVSEGFIGKEHAEDLCYVLLLIEDARTGDSWESFKWGLDKYILTSDEYPYEDILVRSECSLDILDSLINSDVKSTIPLPMPATEILKLVKTHVKQINEFATFRKALDEVKTSYSNGASKEEIQASLEKISDPIPAYDALVGVWGQPEAMAMNALLNQFASDVGIDYKVNSQYFYLVKQYLYQEICAYQKKENEKLEYDYINASIFPRVVGKNVLEDVINALVDEGLLVKEGKTSVSLTNYEDYLFAY